MDSNGASPLWSEDLIDDVKEIGWMAETPPQRRFGSRAIVIVCTASIVLCPVFGVVGWMLHSTGAPSTTGSTIPASNTTAQTSSTYSIQVDVQGDVKHPGVYVVTDNARVADAVRAAGGYVHDADAAYVNAAALLNDGEEVMIPSAGTHASTTGTAVGIATNPNTPSANFSSGSSSGLSQPSNSLIDLNSATLETLETLPDIGPGRANAILTYRTQHGPFQSVSDLHHVHGIGAVIFSRIAQYVYVGSAQH